MRDYLTIGSAPAEEDCAQVGTDDYELRSCVECAAFLHQLIRAFGEEPSTALLSIKTFPHDFGSYREVICYFDDQDREGLEYALKLENETPANWDKEAIEELHQKGQNQ